MRNGHHGRAEHMRDIYAEFRAGTFENLARKLGRGEYVNGEQLALALRSNPNVAVPPRDQLMNSAKTKQISGVQR
jgi:hypothetical protein